MKTIALILAAGEGTRMKSSVNKHLLLLQGRPLILYSLQAFQNHPLVEKIILVGPTEKYRQLLKGVELPKLLDIVAGGKTRQESCWLGLQRVEDADLVIVHDGARPLVEEKTITRVLLAATECGAAIAAVPVKDTLKEVNIDGTVTGTPDRKFFWQSQTPQIIRFDLLRQAHLTAIQDGFVGTDEASLVERMKYPVKISEGDYRNLKVTTSEDLIMAERFLFERQNSSPFPLFRVGLGHDSHPFVDIDRNAKPLILGGSIIEGHRGLAGNSDGDVILHALFNALTQSVGEHSIGVYADPICLEQGVKDSSEYLKIAHKIVTNLGYRIANVGISVECQTPHIEPISTKIKENIASQLNISPNQVGLTATSGEGLTAFGRGEGIQAWAIVCLVLELR